MPRQLAAESEASKKNHLPRAIGTGFVAPLMNSKPTLLTWVTCDGVHIDPQTGKHTLLGIFANIPAPQYPWVHPYMVWFLTLTDCQAGEHKLRISMGVDPSNVAPLMERPFQAHDPVQRINLINEVRNLSFPKPGDYSIVVEIDEETILVTNIVLNG
jgi:hypothetical protein